MFHNNIVNISENLSNRASLKPPSNLPILSLFAQCVAIFTMEKTKLFNFLKTNE